jgi:outer membrane protein OmpA-like peptidoglycan-associated protein
MYLFPFSSLYSKTIIMRKIIFLLFILIPGFCKAFSTIGHAIYFNSGKSEVNPKDQQWIDSISTVIKSAKTYSIDIKGYCDADGSDESNTILAKARAANVLQMFLKNELVKKFIVTNSFGEQGPVADNSTEQGKARNRRVEIAISYQLAEVNSKITNAPEKNENINSEINLSSEKLEVGKTLVLKNLNFEGGTPILLPESEPTLKELLKIMNENPSIEIEIGGHVCCGPDMKLSVMRAERVFIYLKSKGIGPKRMIYKGYSFDKPIADEDTEEGRIKNRRVEITILKM